MLAPVSFIGYQFITHALGLLWQTNSRTSSKYGMKELFTSYWKTHKWYDAKTQICDRYLVEHLYFHTMFTLLQCSASCGEGQKSRDVKCLDKNKSPSSGCDPALMPRDRESCNDRQCPPTGPGRPKPPGSMSHVTRKPVFGSFRPGETQTGLLSFRS